MKFRPAHTCFGCASLLVGVQVTSLLALIIQTVFIATCSSAEVLQVAGLRISPTIQVLCASWAFAGIPVAVCAGVGALFRIDHLVRLFFWYLVLSFPLGIAVPSYLLATGKVCDSVVHEEIQRMGSAFVCGFTDTFVFMWTMVVGLVHLYFVYIIWSAAEDIARNGNSYPALNKYTNKLKNMADEAPQKGKDPYTALAVNHPIVEKFAQVNGFFPMANSQAAGTPQSFAPVADRFGPQSFTDAQPQSFMPSPGSYLAPQSPEPPREANQQQTLFNALDRNHDGVISRAEFDSAAGTPQSFMPAPSSSLGPQSFVPMPASRADFRSTA